MPIAVSNTDLVYFPVPKIACSSIKYALMNHNEDGLADKMPVTLPDGRTIKYTHGFYPSTKFRPWTPLQFRGKRWFALVRDPLKRFVSAHSNRILHHDDIKKTDPAKLEAAGLPRQPELEEFVMHLEAYCRLNKSVKHHVRPMCDYLGRRPDRFHKLFTMAEISQIEPWCTEQGAPISLPHRQTGGPKVAVDVLSPAAREKLLAFYAEDYRVWDKFING